MTVAAVRLQDAAVRLARNGFAVLPLLPRQKRPRFLGGYKSATSDPAAVADHWMRFPDDNVGVRPGPGRFVVDEDPRNGGDRELSRLTRYRGQLPETWMASTPSGGRHLWFVGGDLGEVRGKLCQGVDVKHGGTGFVVVPPSIGANGRRYQWLIAPTGEPADAPLWLRLAIRPPPPPLPRQWTRSADQDPTGPALFSLNCLVARIAAAPEGNRNTTVFGAMRDARKQGDLDAFEPRLIAAAQHVGLPDAEISTIRRSARRGDVP